MTRAVVLTVNSAARGTDGDALYSNATLALDPATGKIVWHRQTLPGESHDMDEVFENMLVDVGARKSLFKMGKMSILWELDRRTGKILRATDLGLQNLVKLDAGTGAVSYLPDRLPKTDVPFSQDRSRRTLKPSLSKRCARVSR